MSETRRGWKIRHACLWKLDTNRVRNGVEFIARSNSHKHTHTHTGVKGLRQSNCMSPLPVIFGMSVRQVGADSVALRCAAHIFYSECFLDPSATLTLPPTPSNQYIISGHYAYMHIYRERDWIKEKKDCWNECMCVCVLVGVGVVCSAARSASCLLRKLKNVLTLCFCVPCAFIYVGVPQPRIEWYKDMVPLSKLANPRYKVSAANGLTVRRVQPGDGGIFQCFARNPAGEAQAQTQLFVSSEFLWCIHTRMEAWIDKPTSALNSDSLFTLVSLHFCTSFFFFIVTFFDFFYLHY